MNQDNRVLSRVGARDLTMEEVERVAAGLRTATLCTGPGPFGSGFLDGDPGECGG